MSFSILAIICCKNPTEAILGQNVKALQHYYPEMDIIVVDSDSSQKEFYDCLPTSVTVFKDANNRHYELGAYKFGYTQRPNYDFYMCIQDSFICTGRVPLEGQASATFLAEWRQGFLTHTPVQDIERLKKRALELKPGLQLDGPFLVATHCSFIVSNHTLQTLLETLPNMPTNKEDEIIYERIFGLVLEGTGIRDMNLWFHKVNGGRL